MAKSRDRTDEHVELSSMFAYRWKASRVAGVRSLSRDLSETKRSWSGRGRRRVHCARFQVLIGSFARRSLRATGVSEARHSRSGQEDNASPYTEDETECPPKRLERRETLIPRSMQFDSFSCMAQTARVSVLRKRIESERPRRSASFDTKPEPTRRGCSHGGDGWQTSVEHIVTFVPRGSRKATFGSNTSPKK